MWGLLVIDARPVERAVLALLWPVGPGAFVVTLAILLVAAAIAFPLVGVPLLAATAAQLTGYFGGRPTRFQLPLDLHGSAFQRSVWQALQGIARGQTRSYLDIAREIGAPSAVRAVGAAIGRNPVSVIVPCHRVIGRSGALTGYAGGLARKQALLTLEGVAFQ